MLAMCSRKSTRKSTQVQTFDNYIWWFVVIAYLMKILHAKFGHCCVIFEFMATDYVDFSVSGKTAFPKWCFLGCRAQIPSVQLKIMVFICPKQYYKKKISRLMRKFCEKRDVCEGLIYRWLVDSPLTGQVIQETFPCHDVIIGTSFQDVGLGSVCGGGGGGVRNGISLCLYTLDSWIL